MPLIHELYHSDFHTKLFTAHQLFHDSGVALCAIPHIHQGLITLERQATTLQEQMLSLNVGHLCSSCALKAGGGCCSLYMADENDAVLLLINLLTGHLVSVQKDDDYECYLLGPKGCILRFKPIFCLNYNCQAIKVHTNAAILASYLAASAQLLQQQWLVEQLILTYLMQTQKKLY
nr:hypothetical protein [Desulfobulbaceae bacterium]